MSVRVPCRSEYKLHFTIDCYPEKLTNSTANCSTLPECYGESTFRKAGRPCVFPLSSIAAGGCTAEESHLLFQGGTSTGALDSKRANIDPAIVSTKEASANTTLAGLKFATNYRHASLAAPPP